jgi:hypothetical protein
VDQSDREIFDFVISKVKYLQFVELSTAELFNISNSINMKMELLEVRKIL